MATISSRLTSTGTMLVNGTIDEVTFNTTAGNTAIYNNFSNTQIFDGANWVTSSVSVTPNLVVAPDGTRTGAKLTALNAYPTLTDGARGNPKFPVAGGDVWTVSGYVQYGNLQYMNIVNEYVSGTGWYTGGASTRYDLINGAVSKGANVTAAGMSSVGNGWWRIYSTYTIPAGVTGWNPQVFRMGQFDATNYAGNIVYVWGAQLEKNSTVTTYQPIASANVVVPTAISKTVPDTVYTSGTFDEVTYNPTAGYRAIKNLFKYIETFNFDYTNWTLNNGTMTQNATLAPDGKSLAPKLVETTTLANQRIYNWMPVTAGTTYTYSIYLKAAERYIVRCYFEDTQTGGGGRVGQYLN